MISLYYQSLLNECSLVDPKNKKINDWEYIFSVYEKSSQLDILEKFEFSSETKNSRVTEHNYNIETKSGKSFSVLISYYNPDSSYEIANSSETSAKHKKNNTLANEFEILKNKLRTDDSKICIINFIDSDARNTLTNEVNYESFEVFASLKDSLMDSLLNKNMIVNLSAISFRIAKNEDKRRELYIKMFTRYLGKHFPVIFEDNITNADYNIIYFCKR
jgi:hypothetical protein